MRAWLLRYSSINFSQRNGGTEAATFAALTTLKKQIDREQAVDVYQVNYFGRHFVMAIGTFKWSSSTSNPNSGVQIASQQEAWCVAGPRGLSLHTQGIIYFLKDPLTKVLHSNMDSLSPCHMVRLWRLLVNNPCQMRTQMQSWGRIPMVTKLVTFFFLTFNL